MAALLFSGMRFILGVLVFKKMVSDYRSIVAGGRLSSRHSRYPTGPFGCSELD